MRTFFFLIVLLSFISCGTDQGETKTYTYTVRNESGVSIKVKAFHSFTHEVIFTTTIENGNEIKKIFQDGLPPRGYSFKQFFASLNGEKFITDSIKVIYNNTKFKSFISKDCNGGSRNPLNICAYQGIEETFIFTLEDYENAEDCIGNCE